MGDTILLTRVLELGSRKYTLRAPKPELKSVKDGKEEPGVFSRDWQRNPDSLGKGLGLTVVRVEATVLEQTKGKMEVIVKTKRRKGYTRTLRRKTPFTRLRIGEIKIGDGATPIESI